MHSAGDDPGPSRLMTGTDAGAVVAVEVLVEEQEIAPVRILLELLRRSVDRPAPLRVSHEDAGEAARDLLRDPVERHASARARGAFDRERVSVVGVVLDQ